MEQYSSKSFKDIDIQFWLKHYTNLAWRWKWFILLAFTITVASWTFYMLRVATLRSDLDSSVTIGFENNTDISIGEPKSNQNKMELIRSRNFLGEIVQHLSLQFSIREYARNEIFDYVKVESSVQNGKYEVIITNKQKPGFIVRRYAKKEKKPTIIAASALTEDTISLPGMHLKFTESFISAPHSFTFGITDISKAVEGIYKRLSLKYTDTKQNSSVTVTLTGNDYALDVKTLNSIADVFVNKTLNFRKNRISEMIVLLGKQLQTASSQLDAAENAVRKFKESNPSVLAGRDPNNQSDISPTDTSSLQVDNQLVEAKNINSQLKNEQGPEREIAYNQAIGFLIVNNIASASGLQQDYQAALNKKAEMENTYSPTHPLVLKHQEWIRLLQQRIKGLLQNYIATGERDYRKHKTEIETARKIMRERPSKEMELAQLEQRQRVCAEIYSDVLSKFNQAKIADVINLADVYIMDYAVAPETPNRLLTLLTRLGMGFGVGLMFSFLPPFVVNLFDKTARSELEIKHFFDHPVLESIPVIKGTHTRSIITEGGRTSIVSGKQLIDMNEPDFISELFRSLRTKIISLHASTEKRIVFTSWDMCEGKSLLAANTAVAFAQKGAKTLLIDCDLRRGILHRSFSLKNDTGISNYLSIPEEHDIIEYLQKTQIPKLTLLSAGRHVSNPTELLASQRFTKVMHALSTVFDIILIDTPPIGIVTDPSVISDLAGSYIVIIKAGSTNLLELKKSLQSYPDIQKKVLGFILNQAPLSKRLKRYQKYSL